MDLQELKQFVLKPSTQTQAEGTVVLNVTHSNMKQTFAELRFDCDMTVERVKEKLYNHCGTSVDAMRLQLYDLADRLIVELADSSRMLGFYSPHDGYRLHVIDLNPTSASAGGWLEDVSRVQKYTMSEEDYDKRPDSVRNFKKAQLGSNPALRDKKEISDDYMEDVAALITVGSRCEVEPENFRGTVAYVGRVEGLKKGFWVGVRFDEPVGKGDGSVAGVTYFDCPTPYANFVRPSKVQVGDFPEEDPFGEEDEI